MPPRILYLLGSILMFESVFGMRYTEGFLRRDWQASCLKGFLFLSCFRLIQ